MLACTIDVDRRNSGRASGLTVLDLLGEEGSPGKERRSQQQQQHFTPGAVGDYAEGLRNVRGSGLGVARDPLCGCEELVYSIAFRPPCLRFKLLSGDSYSR